MMVIILASFAALSLHGYMNDVYIRDWREAMTTINYIERHAYQPPAFLVKDVSLTFELGFERTIVRAQLALTRNPATDQNAPLVLDGRDFRLLELSLDGRPEPLTHYVAADEQLTFTDIGSQCTLAAITELAPAKNSTQMGLFRAGRCLVTQCEADGFRRMTFFADRPDVLAPYRVRLEADRTTFPVLLSNGDCVERGELDGGRHYAVWHDPHPKPSYIFAVVAGDLAALRDRHVTGSGREVALAIYAAPEVIDDCRYAMGALKRALAWDEAAYGLEYDLDHYNIVAVDDYTGAMENKGLNLFEAKGILADASYSTDNDYLVLERILGHEVFHNWTGNRVTCRDWFELCLKEGLTRFRDRQFSEAMSAPGPKRIDAVAMLRRNQFPEDDGGAAHPVKPERYADVQNLYTATVYEKGAELIRMLWVLLGDEVFRAGVRDYLAAYDGQAVTTEELLHAMERVSGRDLGQFRTWYTCKGRPRLTIHGDYDATQQRYTLTVDQAPPNADPSAPPLLIPIALQLFARDGSILPLGDAAANGVLEVAERRARFVFEGVPTPPIASVLRGLSAPVSCAIDLTDDALAVLMAHESDAVARWDAAQQLAIRIIRRIAAGTEATAAGLPVYLDAFEVALDRRDDDLGLLARVLTTPDEPMLSDGLAQIDLDGHQRGRNALRGALVTRFGDRLRTLYQELTTTAPYAPEPDAIARRALRNFCLELLFAQPTQAHLELALAQTRTSDNMNDAYAALACLVNVPGPQRTAAIDGCLERWRDSPIAMGQWLTAQALSRAPDAVERIMELTRHPAFNVSNPAHAMALYGSFFRQNRIAFHDPAGRGYALLADALLMIDKRRPSGSFWFMPQINQWRRYDAGRQRLMRAALERVAGAPGISRGLAENVAKALAPI
jgi:aminopeptidase N